MVANLLQRAAEVQVVHLAHEARGVELLLDGRHPAFVAPDAGPDVQPDLEADQDLRLSLSAEVLSPLTVGKLKDILINHPGSAPVFIHMDSNGYGRLLRLDDEFRVELTSSLYAEIRNLLGAGVVA